MAHQLPEGAYLKEISAHFNQNTIPRSLLAQSTLEKEMWARVVVEEGHVNLRLGKNAESERVVPGQAAVIPSETPFSLASSPDPLRFYLEYYHGPRLSDAAELASQLSRR